MSTRKTNEADKKLAECLKMAMDLEYKKLNEEIAQYEDHVFSDAFEAKMQEILTVRSKKEKFRAVYRYGLSAAAVLLLAFGIFSTGFEAKASLPVVDILGWFDDFFQFEKGDSNFRDAPLAFDDSQLQYIPEGFYLAEEDVKFNYIEYQYVGDSEYYFCIRLFKVRTNYTQDNEAVIERTFLNDAGYECFYMVRDGEHIYMWEDEEGRFYSLIGNIEPEELLMIMNGIRYEE